MKKMLLLFLLSFAVNLGCGESKPAIDVNADGPLTIEEWKELDVLIKYELETFDRLKKADPKLKDKQNWDKLMREVIVPERSKDIPTG
jgi:hypothetical protein